MSTIKINYCINLYKKIAIYGFTWWIHIEEEEEEESAKNADDVVYRVSLMNEEQEVVYVKDFHFGNKTMSSNYFITIAKQTISEYDAIRKENLAITVAAHNFECYEGDWLEEEID